VTRDAGALQLDATQVQGLRGAIRGPVLVAGDPGYDETLAISVGDLLKRRPYVTLQSLLDATQPKGRRSYWKSEYLPGIEPEMLAKQREHAERILSPHSAVIVFQLGGAIANRRVDH
jgi:hypothetical protein